MSTTCTSTSPIRSGCSARPTCRRPGRATARRSSRRPGPRTRSRTARRGRSGPVTRADSVVDRVIGALVARVENGEFSAGERLPPETDLAADLDVSRLSLREAVRALAGAGVLEVRRGDGTFVTDLRPDRLVRATGSFLELVGEQGVAE